MADVERRMHAKGYLRVRHAQVRIEQHDLVTLLRQFVRGEPDGPTSKSTPAHRSVPRAAR